MQVALGKIHILGGEGVAVVIVDEVLHLAEQLSRLLFQCVFLALHTDTLVMVLLHTYTHTYIHTYTHTYIHTYKHTYIQTRCTHV